MVTIPTPEEALGPGKLSGPVNPAQIDGRVASYTGAAGKAWGHAVEAIGGAFSELAERTATVNDATAESRAKLDWFKADQETWRNLSLSTQQDGTGWEQAPKLYDAQRSQIMDRYPISNPQRRAALDGWMQQQVASRGFQAADQKQRAQAGWYTGIEDKETVGAAQQLLADPSQANLYRLQTELHGLVESGRGLYHSNGDVQARKDQITAALTSSQFRAYATSDPSAAMVMLDKIRRGQHELDQASPNYQPQGGSEPSRLVPNRGPAGLLMDRNGVEFLKKIEGSEDQGWDYQQYSGPYGVKRGANEKLTLDQAEQRLHQEAGEVDKEIQQKIKVPLNQNQHNALVSFFYNLGTGKGRLDKVAEMINSGRASDVPGYMSQFVNAGGDRLRGLVDRRRAEVQLFNAGGPPAGSQNAPAQNAPAQADQPQRVAGLPATTDAGPQGQQVATRTADGDVLTGSRYDEGDAAGTSQKPAAGDVMAGSRYDEGGGTATGDTAPQQPGQPQPGQTTVPTGPEGEPQQGQPPAQEAAAEHPAETALRGQISAIHAAAAADPSAKISDALPQEMLGKLREMVPGMDPDALDGMTMGQASALIKQLMPETNAQGPAVEAGPEQWPMGRMVGGQVFSVKSKFGEIRISAEAVNAVGLRDGKLLSQLWRQVQEGQRFKWQTEIKDDLKMLEQTGKGRSDAEIESWIKAGPGRLPTMKNQVARYKELRQQARLTFEATSGLADMSPEDAQAHLSKYAPKLDDGEGHYSQKAYAQAKALLAWHKIEKARDVDPVAASMAAAEVKTAQGLLQPGDLTPTGQIRIGPDTAPSGPAEAAAPARASRIENLLGARIAAQQRLGIYSAKQRILTKPEADALLQMGDPKDLSDQQITDGLKGALARAKASYGSYAGRAFQDAIKLTRSTQSERDMAAIIVGPLLRGELKPKDVTGGGWFSGWFGGGHDTFDANKPGRPSAPGPSQMGPWPTPDGKHKSWIKSNPDGRAAYDARFGPGAAGAVLGK